MDDCPRHHCTNCDFDFYLVWSNDGIGIDFPEMYCPRCGEVEIETSPPLSL